MQVYYAIRDCLGFKDIIFDTQQAFPDLCNPLALCLPSRGRIRLIEDEEAPLLESSGGFRRYVLRNQATAVEFELDAVEEEEYEAARRLVFGDFRFPVIHEDWRHPPQVQNIIDGNAARFYENLNGSREDSPVDLQWSDEEDDLLIPPPPAVASLPKGNAVL